MTGNLTEHVTRCESDGSVSSQFIDKNAGAEETRTHDILCGR
jgi:hypothetical protein